MLHSNVEKNWLRVELMYSVVHEYFSLTKDSDFRKRIINSESIFPYNLSVSQNMNKESSLVDMVIVWGVVALESLINYALAELQNDFELSKKSINYPKKILKERNISPVPESKLATKIVILKNEPNHAIINLADMLSNNRNKIIHDKPINYEMYDNEEVITHYGSATTFPSYRHEDLKDFFIKCDEIKNYIIKDNILETLEIRDFSTMVK